MHTVKVFQSGNSQAVRIPKEYKVDAKELYIQKVGKSLVLTSKEDIWDSFRESIKNFSEDLFSNGREQPQMQERESF